MGADDEAALKARLQQMIDFESCAQCCHFFVCHKGTKCSGWTEGDRDDLVLECGCVSFVSSESN